MVSIAELVHSNQGAYVMQLEESKSELRDLWIDIAETQINKTRTLLHNVYNHNVSHQN